MVHLRIFHLNDLHSRYESMARIATALKTYNTQPSLLFDTGDHADFMRMETEGTRGEISSALLNQLECSARVFGNNEGFSGLENGHHIAHTSTCPVVTCNLYNQNHEKLPFLHDSTIIKMEGLRILVIGVTASYNEFYHLMHMHAKDPMLEVARVLEAIPPSSYDLLFLLSHLGLEQDKTMAQKFPHIDLIIGGHSHTEITEPIKIGQTYICQAGGYGKYLGMLDLEIGKENGHYKICTYQTQLILVDQHKEDPTVIKTLQKFAQIAKNNLSRPILTLPSDISHSLTKENLLSNFLADALKDIFIVDFALIHSGILNHGLKKGNISKLDLLEVTPSPLNPTYMEIQGKYIRIALEESLIPDFQMMDGRGSGFRGKFLGNLAVSSNVRVSYHPSETPLNKIIAISINGIVMEDETWYKVCTSDYLQRGTGYKSLAHNQNEKYDPRMMKEVLAKYLPNQSLIHQAFTERFLEEE